MSIDPNLELHIHRTIEEREKGYSDVFAKKWVEKTLTWALYGVGGIALVALVKAVAPFL